MAFGGALPYFLFCSLFPAQQTTSGIDHRSPCNVVFFGSATNTLNVGNKSNNNCRESAGTGPVNLKVVPNGCYLGRVTMDQFNVSTIIIVD